MRTIILCSILSLVFASSFGCQKDTEQDRVKNVIIAVQKAAEAKDFKTITGNISTSYSDRQGNNYGAISRLVLAYFYQYPKISVHVANITITVQNGSANARFEAILTGKTSPESPPTVLPETLGAYAFDVAFRKESGEWKVLSAQWHRIGEPDKL
ncbi:MAG: hypothetical protein GX423_11750 [Nitrospiraceae bacterium]|jgi:hypothetical protein|nr:hypothetical protein [Nitrospiraceae bacterium]